MKCKYWYFLPYRTFSYLVLQCYHLVPQHYWVLTDISMLIPEQTMLTIDVTTLDVTDLRESGAKPKLHTNGAELHEEDLILCKTDITDTK